MFRLLCVAVLLVAVPSSLFAQTGIEVTKEVDFPAAPYGYEVTYTLTVENLSGSTLILDYVSDTLLGDITGLFSSSLSSGATETVETPYVLQYDDPDPLLNSVDFSYTDKWGTQQMDDDQATVDIFHPLFATFVECPDPPPPPGEDVMITVGLQNVGDVTMIVTITSPPGFDPMELGIGATLNFLVFAPCVGDEACIDVTMVADLPEAYGISHPIDIAIDHCCPCNGAPVEEESWGVIKALFK